MTTVCAHEGRRIEVTYPIGRTRRERERRGLPILGTVTEGEEYRGPVRRLDDQRWTVEEGRRRGVFVGLCAAARAAAG
jgi:hypothetical protein